MWETKLPKKAGGHYLVTLKTSFGLQVRQANCIAVSGGGIGWCVLPECSTHYNDVIAWMKEPKPYQQTGNQ